jgi:hypothetical protein
VLVLGVGKPDKKLLLAMDRALGRETGMHGGKALHVKILLQRQRSKNWFRNDVFYHK